MIGWILPRKVSMLQALILSSLSHEGETASAVIEHLNQLGDPWIPHRGSVYPAINNLEGRGLLRKVAERPMKLQLTPEGEDFLYEIAEGIKENLTIVLEAINLFQSNLASHSDHIRVKFLEQVTKQLQSASTHLETELGEAAKELDSWKDVKVE